MTGLDAMTDYYDVSLKQDRHKLLDAHDGFRRIEGRLEDMETVRDALGDGQDAVIHLAAQAGVRYSIDAPETYVQSNLIGTFNLLEVRTTQPDGSFADGVNIVGLWRQHQDALCRDRPRCKPDVLLCRDQGRKRSHGPFLRASL